MPPWVAMSSGAVGGRSSDTETRETHRRHRARDSEGERMSGVRVLVGTRKGAFVLTADGRRERWDVSGPHFPGWEIYHVKGSPADPGRLYASQSSSWFGQLIQRSDDGGATWEPVGNEFVYDGVPGTHQWYDGTPRPWTFTRVWHLEPSLTDPDTVFGGVEDAALFRSSDGGRTWQELPGLRGHGLGPPGSPARAGCACTRSSSIRPTRAGSSLRSPRPGPSGPTTPERPGARSTGACAPRGSLTRPRRSGTACTGSRCTPPAPTCCSCRSTGT